MKNPFKMKNVLDSATAILIGGAGNVAMDYVFKNVPFLQTLGADGTATSETTKNAIKIVAGAVGGSLVPSKYGWLKSALDGTAIVGASQLIEGYLPEGDETPKTTGGAPFIGAARRLGQRGYRRAILGTGDVPFMS